MTRKYPLPGCLLTGDEIAELSRQKIASLSPEEAQATLEEVQSEESDEIESDDFESVPKTAEDQEAFGVGIYMGTKEASRRFNELTDAGLPFEDTMSKVAEEIEAFDAETAALRDALNADPDQELMADVVAKVAEEAPEALAEFALKKLAELGYEVKQADDDDDGEGVEDEETEETEEAEEAAE